MDISLMTKQAVHQTTYLPKVLILGIQAPYNRTKDIDSYFQEFLSLIKTSGVTYHEKLFIKLREISPVYFLSKGKLEELKELCDKKNIEELICSEPLTAQQERNLSDMLNVHVFDRTKLILEIFEKSAHSAEGKTQVAVALLKHKKSRLAGKGINMSQQRGIVGLRGGFGETAKEKETRDIGNQILKLKKKLQKIKNSRDIQRKKRLENKVPHAFLIGYTNAGKSTILNTLTKSSVLAEDKLFATLDTTTRALYIDGEKKGLISDSVGFIQNLPHHLIEAFKSTLDELHYADLLLHVVDISDPTWELHIKVVHEILHDLNVDKKMVYVFNKSDKVNFEDNETLLKTVETYQPFVLTNALKKDGLQALKLFLSNWHPQNNKEQ